MEEVKTVAFDLETIADPTAVSILPPVEPDSRLKDPTKIKADIEKKEQAQIDKLGVNPRTNLICCASFIDLDSKEIWSFLLSEKLDENTLLRRIWEYIFPYERFVTFNGNQFDVECLKFHSMLHRVPMSQRLSQHPYQRGNHIDLRAELSGGNQYQKGDFDFYCKRLGGAGKTEGMDGSQVQGFWDAGKRIEIREYCERDVTELARLYFAMQGYYF